MPSAQSLLDKIAADWDHAHAIENASNTDRVNLTIDLGLTSVDVVIKLRSGVNGGCRDRRLARLVSLRLMADSTNNPLIDGINAALAEWDQPPRTRL